MKKIISLFLVLLLIFSLSACGKTEENSTNTQSTSQTVSEEKDNVSVPDTYTFTGQIVDIEGEMILVETDEQNSAISPQVYVNVSQFKNLGFKKGDKVRVVFNGQVAQSYPPQILGVKDIKIENKD